MQPVPPVKAVKREKTLGIDGAISTNASPQYLNYPSEELRVQDYEANRKKFPGRFGQHAATVGTSDHDVSTTSASCTVTDTGGGEGAEVGLQEDAVMGELVAEGSKLLEQLAGEDAAGISQAVARPNSPVARALHDYLREGSREAAGTGSEERRAQIDIDGAEEEAVVKIQALARGKEERKRHAARRARREEHGQKSEAELLAEGGILLQRLPSEDAEALTSLLMDPGRAGSPVAHVLRDHLTAVCERSEGEGAEVGLQEDAVMGELVAEGSKLLEQLAGEDAAGISQAVARPNSPVARALHDYLREGSREAAGTGSEERRAQIDIDGAEEEAVVKIQALARGKEERKRHAARRARREEHGQKSEAELLAEGGILLQRLPSEDAEALTSLLMDPGRAGSPVAHALREHLTAVCVRSAAGSDGADAIAGRSARATDVTDIQVGASSFTVLDRDIELAARRNERQLSEEQRQQSESDARRAYLQRILERFPSTYRELQERFIELLDLHRSRSISTQHLLISLSDLFKGAPDLIIGSEACIDGSLDSEALSTRSEAFLKSMAGLHSQKHPQAKQLGPRPASSTTAHGYLSSSKEAPLPTQRRAHTSIKADACDVKPISSQERLQSELERARRCKLAGDARSGGGEKLWKVQMPFISINQAYQRDFSENTLPLDFSDKDQPFQETRNSLLTFSSDFRLRAACGGTYDLRDKLQFETLKKQMHAGGLKETSGDEIYDQALELSISLEAPGIQFEAAPQLVVSRRDDVVLNKGWHEAFRLQAIGWSKKSSSTRISFAPCARVRFSGFDAAQAREEEGNGGSAGRVA